VIQDVLAHFPEVRKAVLFGSRAKGTAKQGSDIDLALHGEGLDWRLLGRIENELADLLCLTPSACFTTTPGPMSRWPRTLPG
jgi:predicted nucleotidyltransferase